jgi:hypothetical protein
VSDRRKKREEKNPFFSLVPLPHFFKRKNGRGGKKARNF